MECTQETQVNEASSESSVVKIEHFYVKTENPNEFIDELEQLCKEYSHQRDFFFKYSVED